MVSRRHGVVGDGGEVGDERAEAMDGRSSSVRLVAALRLAALERRALVTIEGEQRQRFSCRDRRTG
jgi:hypothetical protein